VYAARGAALGLVARREERLREIAASLPSKPDVYAADVRDQRTLQAAAADFIARRGLPDIVIGNAGISVGTLTEFADDANVFRETLETNVTGLVQTFQPFVQPMRAAGRGTLVGIASVAGFRGLPGAGAYSASKAAAIGYCESLRVELHGSGVSVVTICPGFIDTPMTKKNPYPMPFLLDADDAARRMARAIDARKTFCVIPWQMAIVGALLRILPNAVYDRILAGRARKPRAAKP
jgi:short-subunit dehydrogenase